MLIHCHSYDTHTHTHTHIPQLVENLFVLAKFFPAQKYFWLMYFYVFTFAFVALDIGFVYVSTSIRLTSRTILPMFSLIQFSWTSFFFFFNCLPLRWYILSPLNHIHVVNQCYPNKINKWKQKKQRYTFAGLQVI